MKKLFLILLILLCAGLASAECTQPKDSQTITEDTVFCSRTFDLPNGISIGADNITIACNMAILRGNSQQGTGITVEGRKNVIIEGCNVLTYKTGILIKDSSRITIKNNNMIKNEIGMRLYNAYENTIAENADKSTDHTLSVINSKFNTFMLDNKNIEQDFCKENLCNKQGKMNPCENNDFYCSDACSPENDNDCKPKAVPIPEEQKSINTSTPTAMAVQEVQKAPEPAQKKKSNWYIYAIFYAITFLLLQFYTYTRQF